MRARDLGIPLEGIPGAHNAITDVPTIEVGFTTLISGEGPLVVGQGPVRTGVTVILPHGKTYDPVSAAWYSLNGNGEMTGTPWIDESGFLETPIGITNTHSVGVVHDGIIAWMMQHRVYDATLAEQVWLMPVVAETFDGRLNDINGFHITREHVFAALDGARSGIVPEGNVGGGTGMICFGFKGGTGTSSRRVRIGDSDYSVGVLVQSNFGSRPHLTIAGVPVGRELTDLMPVFQDSKDEEGAGSIIVLVATDAPLLPHQLKRIVRRVPLALARLGSLSENGSGDLFIAFSVANRGAIRRTGLSHIDMLPNDRMNPLFEATIQATEEAVLNALVAAESLRGINGNTVYALPHNRVRELLKKHRPLAM
jgi:D-aminopeptidase